MARESAIRRQLVEMLGHRGAYAIENLLGAGMPDVVTADCWIEIKQVAWPARATTPIRLPHFSPAQRAWHRRHAARAPSWCPSFVLVRLGPPRAPSWALLRGVIAAAWEDGGFFTAEQYQMLPQIKRGDTARPVIGHEGHHGVRWDGPLRTGIEVMFPRPHDDQRRVAFDF